MPNLDNYVSVAERVSQAQDAIRSVHADTPFMLTDAMGYIRVTVVLKDERSATGTASFRLDLPGKGAQATNPIEDCETSAIGRALAFLGYSSSKSIASAEEVQEARRREGASYSGNGHTGGAGKASDKQIGLLRGLWKKSGYTDSLDNWISDAYGCAIDALTSKQASSAIDALQPKES